MDMAKIKSFFLGSLLVGSMAVGADSCTQKKQDKAEKPKTEVKAKKKPQQKDPYGNIELFEKSRSDIKFALAFVENYYPYVYWCGKSWTTGHGLTILYTADGKSSKVTQNTKIPTLDQSDVYKGRYLTYEILPDIISCVKVPMDENTLIAACVLRYCIGGSNFKKSLFLKWLNEGKTGAELAKTLTGWRVQDGVPNRCYFFAALMAGKIDFTDLLDLRAEGCYNLTYTDMFVYYKGHPKRDQHKLYEWDFSKIKQNLQKAKKQRVVVLNLGRKKGKVKVNCKLVKEIVPRYIWQEVSDKNARKKRKNTKKALSMVAQEKFDFIAAQNHNHHKQLAQKRL